MMKRSKVLSKNDMLVRVATMYYKQNLTQQEIADELYLSRSNISRLLKNCVEQGIVEFYINETSSKGYDLREELKNVFGLKDAIVIPSHDNLEIAKENLAKNVFMYLQRSIKDCSLLGVSWGTTLYHLAMAFRPLANVSASVVQLVGGQGALSHDTDGTEITKKIAKALGGDAYIPHVPYLVEDPKLKELLMCEPNVKEHFERARKVDIALVGVGSSELNINSAKRAGYLSTLDIDNLKKAGAVADVCGIQLDSEGNFCAPDYDRKRIGLCFEDINKIPFVLAVCVGTEKTAPIFAALKSGLIDVIALDENTAEAVLNL